MLKLDLKLPGQPLNLPVKEVEVLDSAHQELHAFKTNNNNNGEAAVLRKTAVWTPPLLLYLADKPGEIREIRDQLSVCMRGVFAIREGDPRIRQDLGQCHWPWPCFDSDENDWEGYVTEEIFKYWNKDIPAHSVLGKAHALLFFAYILDHMFMVTGDALVEMLSNLQNKHGFDPNKDVSPDTVNSFLKMIVFQWFLEMAKDVLTELQTMLHSMALGKETSTARSDIAFCLSFIMLIVLGQTQSRLLLLSTYDKRETGIELPLEEAERLIIDMEREVGSYIVHFHEFALKRRKPMAASPNSIDQAERHAARFGLMQKVEELTLHQFSAYPIPVQRFGTEFPIVGHRPRRFKLPQRVIETFDVENTHRLCWKFVEAIGICQGG